MIESLHPRLAPLKVGVIGLGAGTIAAYGAQGRRLSLLRHQPRAWSSSRNAISRYLSDSDATIEIALGDARLSLEREAPQNFDLLAIDAFSSDAIPVHLITVEALDVYRRHMKPGGVIAFHVTNRFLDLVPVVEALAQARGMRVAVDRRRRRGRRSRARSDWVLLASDGDVLDRAADQRGRDAASSRTRDWRLWTDDFNNLLQVLKH